MSTYTHGFDSRAVHLITLGVRIMGAIKAGTPDLEQAPYIGEDDVEEILSTIKHWYEQHADVSGDVYMARLYKIVHHSE